MLALRWLRRAALGRAGLRLTVLGVGVGPLPTPSPSSGWADAAGAVRGRRLNAAWARIEPGTLFTKNAGNDLARIRTHRLDAAVDTLDEAECSSEFFAPDDALRTYGIAQGCSEPDGAR